MLTRREILALILAFVITLPAVTTRLYASDEVQYFAWLRSIAFDRDADFENEYQHFFDAGVARSTGFHETFLERTNEAGRRINYATIGTPILWAPFYAAAHVGAQVSGAPTDGFSRPYVAAVAYGSACYGFLAIVLSALISRRIVGRGLLASLMIAVGTPLVFYAYIAPGFAHATSAFTVSLFIWVWLRVRDRWSPRGAIVLGVCGALMWMVREQDLLLVVGPGVDFLRHALRAGGAAGGARGRARLLVTAVAGAGAFALAYAPQLLAYSALNGHPGPTETMLRKITWTAPHALSVLVSTKHGLLAWTPLVLLAIAGLVVLSLGRLTTSQGNRPAIHPDARWIGGLALLMLAAQIYTSGIVESWTVAGSFGQRRFLALTPVFTLGLAAIFVWGQTPLKRRTLIALVVLCVWWNVGLMAQFALHRMDRQQLTLAENARVTFLEFPFEAPAIVWRYLTDRSSFYNLPPK